MTDNPKVSVIIPVHNGSRTLSRCLESVLDQTYDNYEIIIVNNNSTDETEQIIATFVQRDGRIKVVFEGHRSRGAARNAGIRRAAGEIIAMIDVDCVAPRGWLSELTKPIVLEGEQIVMGFETGLGGDYWAKNIQFFNEEFIRRNLNGKYISFLDTKNFAIKTPLMRKTMFDPRIYNMEDFDFYLRVREFARIKFHPSVRVQHSHRDTLGKTARTQYDRGFWITKIFLKYRSQGLKHPMMESLSLENFLLFPPWMFLQFIKRPLTEVFFILVSEISWRIGIVGALLQK